MSDSAQNLAARVPPEEVARIAADALAWLVAEGIVEEKADDSGLGRPRAHRPGKNAASVVLGQKPGVMDFRTLRTNGMELHCEGWEVLTSHDEMPSFACPSCHAQIESDEVFPHLDALAAPGTPPPEVTCPKCGKLSPLPSLEVENGALTNLSFHFWNWWPLLPAFVQRLEKQCGAPLVVLHERL
jgi:hypothetical protein